MQQYDLIIVGGGLVGASLAIALRDAPLSIALLDARMPSQPDPRLFALNASSCQFLANLDLLDKLIPHATPIEQVHVSRKGYFGSVRLNASDAGLSTLGHVIPAEHIERVLTETLYSLSRVTVFTETRLQDIKRENEQFVLQINKRDDLRTSFILAADGSHSTVREVLNIGAEIIPYQQSALVTRTTLPRPHQYIAYERFNDNGAIAMLPLPNHECATIWSADTSFIAELMSLSDEAFLQQLQTAFGYRLGRLQQIGQRFIFPLQMICAEKPTMPGVLLIGNAAHTLHPVAAQGFNLALYEVAVIAEKILDHLKHHAFLSPNLSQTIHDNIHHQLTTSTQLSHRLSQLCTTRSYLMNTLLQIGMTGLDLFPVGKKTFIEKILGKSAFIPRLLLEK